MSSKRVGVPGARKSFGMGDRALLTHLPPDRHGIFDVSGIADVVVGGPVFDWCGLGHEQTVTHRTRCWGPLRRSFSATDVIGPGYAWDTPSGGPLGERILTIDNMHNGADRFRRWDQDVPTCDRSCSDSKNGAPTETPIRTISFSPPDSSVGRESSRPAMARGA